MRLRRTAAGAAGGIALALTASLAGCSATPNADSQAVTITIGNQPAASQTADLALFKKQVAEFKKLHPKWTIKTSETGWDAQTFEAKLAGGDLPTVIGVPFTEMSGLIQRGQVADITDALQTTDVTKSLNPTILDMVKDAKGRIYGVPTSAYTLGLVYNRALFTKAGLDPDKPPTTWDEVRADAKTIAEATGQTGYAQLTKDNQGGWILTAQVYSRGGSMENAKGTKATIDTAETKAALEYLRQLRWDDDSMGSNFLLGAQDLAQQFSAGQVGMLILQPDAYGPVTSVFKFPSKDFGFGAMPAVEKSDPSTTLSGGNIEIVNPKATDAQRTAAVEWIDFLDLRKYTSKSVALETAKAAADAGTPVAIPGLPAVSDAVYTKYLEWIKNVNNVPVENFQPYLDRAPKQVVRAEPVADAQELYAALDPVVQAVLTDRNADIDNLLSAAQAAVQAKLGR